MTALASHRTLDMGIGAELGPDTIQARPYQEEAADAARNELRKPGRRATAIILPTGVGKTVAFAKICRMAALKGRRSLVLAHRKELIEQAAKMIERVGVLPGIERAESRARSLHEPWTVVGTTQTMRGARLRTWEPDHFGLIVVDEAHHATAKSYQTIFNHFTGAKLVGVTATPDRADESEILDTFESVAYEMSIWQAMTATPPGPWLCRLKFVQCDVQIDLRDIRTTAGDYNLGELEAAIGPLVEQLANAIRQEIGTRPTLVFCPDVGSSMAMATALQSMGITAEWVSGDDKHRDHKIEGYKRGEYQVLVNCNLLTEGFDAPHTAAVVLCRPTKSRALYSQMVGRGTRLKTGMEHEDCLLVDFAYLTDKMDLVRPADLFDRSDRDDEEGELLAEIVGKAAAEQQAFDLLEAVEKARAEHRERQVLRIKAQAKEIKYRRIAYDPLSMAASLGVTMRQGSAATHSPATEGQIRTLHKFRMVGVENLSKRQAGRLLDVVIARARENKGSPAQVAYCIALGEDPAVARSLGRKEISERIDALKNGCSV